MVIFIIVTIDQTCLIIELLEFMKALCNFDLIMENAEIKIYRYLYFYNKY